MTEIAFHFNVADKLGYSCRLLRKAYLSGAQILVTGDSADLALLDDLLWTFAPTEFVPHAMVTGEKSALFSDIPVLLTSQPAQCLHNQILVNLGLQVPDTFERFVRLIEIVSNQDSDRLAARRRWKLYADRGYTIQKHDLAATADIT